MNFVKISALKVSALKVKLKEKLISCLTGFKNRSDHIGLLDKEFFGLSNDVPIKSVVSIT